METLASQFEDAVSNVTISPDKQKLATAAHTEVRNLLESDAVLREWGVDPILIGSYARQTGRHPGKDVDIFLRFTKLSIRDNPSVIYDRVAQLLIRQYGRVEDGGRVTLQARSVKVDFGPPSARPDLGFSVDAVPAVPWGEHWGIPARDRTDWSDANTRWMKTSPVAFADASTALSTRTASPTVGDRNAYKPIVRLLRQVRHTHLGEARPGGLYVEIAAYYVWEANLVSGGSWAELLAASLRQVSTEFSKAITNGMADPILGTSLTPGLSAQQWRTAASLFIELADKADEASSSGRCRAAKIWREILGANERGQILPLPPGCAADGSVVPRVTAVSAAGPTQARGFALST